MHRIARYILSHKTERVTLRELKRASSLSEQAIASCMWADHGAEGLAAYNWVGAPESSNAGGGSTS